MQKQWPISTIKGEHLLDPAPLCGMTLRLTWSHSGRTAPWVLLESMCLIGDLDAEIYEGYTCAPQVRRRAHRRCRRAGIILLNCRSSETCNKKEKTPLHDHLEYLPIQNPLNEQHKDRT